MARYFIDVAYKGTNYAGFQIQQNANTVQAEVQKALQVYFRQPFELTGSSRTDAGVHAQQNFFHFNAEIDFNPEKAIYHLNALLPTAIVLKKIILVEDEAHCRFDASSRSYVYTIYVNKNPFLEDTGFYYPYLLDRDLLNQAAQVILGNHDFQGFSKKNTQVHTHFCTISKSEWSFKEELITYNVIGSRFLRGMVRGLVGTMLLVGRKKYSIDTFKKILESKNATKTDFSTPAKGLVLQSVTFPYLIES
jgi:tRNA pseudouridine38-40 synthase